VTHPNEQLIRDATENLSAGNAQAFIDAHADDVVVHISGRNALAGDHRGKQELTSAFQKQMDLMDAPPAFEIHDAMATDDHAVLLGIQKGMRNGKTLESNVVVVAHVREGKFAEVWVVSADPYEEDEFLS
jgi:uncharacterized protein